MLIMAVSLAITVVGTRFYLEITGYPQLGNDTFHIAHALWGGLLQAIASILMLIYLNRWIYMLSAALSGVGIGLFIDEIGKFITKSNDYFFPLAAPLIYITLILAVLLYLYILRDDNHDARGNMYNVLDNLKLLLDHRIEKQHYEEFQLQLNQLANQTERPDIAKIASALREGLSVDSNWTYESEQNSLHKIHTIAKQIEAKYFTRTVVRRILMGFFFFTGMGSALLVTGLALILTSPDYLEAFILDGILQNSSLIRGTTSLNWYFVLMVLNIIIGIIYLIALLSFIRHRDNVAIYAGIIGLVLSLTVGSTLSFYFNQFSVISSSLFLFVLLLMVLRYRDRFLQDTLSSPM